MTAANFAKCLEIELVYEGGKTTNPKDPGNWTGGKVGVGTLKGTNFGIAASSHPNLDIMALTKDQAGAIYKKQYWDTCGCDNLADGLDLAVFAPSINSGPGKALKWYATVNGMATDAAITALFSKRLSFLHALTTWSAFGKGWGVRCAGEEAKAHAMCLTFAEVHAKAMIQADKSNDAKTQAKIIAVGATVTAGGLAAATSTIAPSVAVIVVGWITAAVHWFNSWRHSQRADALSIQASK